LKFIYSFNNVADNLLPREVEDQTLQEEVLNASIQLKELLFVGNSNKLERNHKYKLYREIIKNNPEAWRIVGSWIKEHHSFDELVETKKYVVGYKTEIHNQFKLLIETFELKGQSIIDNYVKKHLSMLNNEFAIRRYWDVSLQNISIDPEDSISRSKALLETIFKLILDDKKVNYDTHKDDFPKLYKLVSEKLDLSPGAQHEQMFNQIMNGCKSVVEGVNAVRGKFGSSHGKNNSQLKNLPLHRHAELVVNLSGAMGIFLIKTWKNN